MFFETSLLNAPVLRVDDITIREGQNAYLESPILMTTGADGKCVSFRWVRLNRFIIFNFRTKSSNFYFLYLL